MTPRSRLAAALAALAAAAFSLPSAAGAQSVVAAGQTVTGALTSRDPVQSDGAHYHLYRLRGSAGDRLRIVLRSADFDAYLLFGTGGLDCDPLCWSDDDGAGGTDAAIRAALTADGDYDIIVTSLQAEETGRYTLEIGTMAPLPPPAALAVGEVVRGSIAATDAEDEDGSFYDEFRIRGTPGTRLRIDLRSTDFDAWLEWGRYDANGEFEVIRYDDDGGANTDARLTVTIATADEYVIRASTLMEGSFGEYTLQTALAPPAAQPKPQEIGLGATVHGRLDEQDAELDDGHFYDAYTVRGEPGSTVAITLRSGEFDAYLTWGRFVGGEWQEIAVDDDSGGDTDARLIVTLGAAGEYMLRARAFAAGSTGGYLLSVEAAPR